MKWWEQGLNLRWNKWIFGREMVVRSSNLEPTYTITPNYNPHPHIFIRTYYYVICLIQNLPYKSGPYIEVLFVTTPGTPLLFGLRLPVASSITRSWRNNGFASKLHMLNFSPHGIPSGKVRLEMVLNASKCPSRTWSSISRAVDPTHPISSPKSWKVKFFNW